MAAKFLPCLLQIVVIGDCRLNVIESSNRACHGVSADDTISLHSVHDFHRLFDAHLRLRIKPGPDVL
jgi:hypothetical protein